MGLGDSIAALFQSKPPTPPDPITTEMMAAAGIAQDKINAFLAPLNAACREFDIVTPLRACAFLAQVTWESEEFKYMREIWGPTAAQQGYEGRKDLGNTQRGDGWKYRGGGLIETTGRGNFAETSVALFGDPNVLLNNPDKLAEPVTACRAAGFFFLKHGCNELADARDMVAVTRRVNGGTNGLSGRLAIYATLTTLTGV